VVFTFTQRKHAVGVFLVTVTISKVSTFFCDAKLTECIFLPC